MVIATQVCKILFFYAVELQILRLIGFFSTQQLCLALADLALQMTSWKNVSKDLIERYLFSFHPLLVLCI